MSSFRQHRDLTQLDSISEAVPWTHSRACHLLYNLVMTFDRPEVLEIACCYGKASIYLAAGAADRGGFLRTVDLAEHVWNGQSAVDLLRSAGLLEVCRIEFGRDARWYMIELLTERPGQWVDLVYLDLTHTVEVDAFVALAAWTHLRPGGILVFDDLSWIPAIHGSQGGPGDVSGVERPNVSHVRSMFAYLAQLPDVADKAEWGQEELDWTWGFLRKRERLGAPEVALIDLLRVLDDSWRLD